MRGGARRSLYGGQTLHEPTGGDKPTIRVTYQDRHNEARFIMSSRIAISPGLRSVANLYGHSVLMVGLGPGHEFAQEAVDGGKNGANGGPALRQIQAAQVARVAQICLNKMPAITHRANSGKFQQGAHRPIPVRKLVDGICVCGYDISEVALRAAWWQKKDTDLPFVPRPQSKKLKAALIAALEAIDEEFQDHGIDARGLVGVVVVR